MLDLDYIRTRRKGMRLTQQQAADMADMKGGRVKWHDIESGRNDNPSLRTLEGMARALHCSIAKLVKR